MKGIKRPKLPRGLRWRSNSPFIWFSWRDSRGKQHQQSTETANPAEALSNKLKFLAKQEHERKDFKAQANEMGKLPLERVAELYFNWKAASSSPRTIERERRIFAPVLKFLARELRVSAITLPLIREYQQQRRLHVSKTMKQPVTGRTVNYEMHLLRGMMIFADCWTDSLAARYTPLRQIKKRAGKVAEKVQLMDIINKAKGNEYWQLAMYCAAVAVGTGCPPNPNRSCHRNGAFQVSSVRSRIWGNNRHRRAQNGILGAEDPAKSSSCTPAVANARSKSG